MRIRPYHSADDTAVAEVIQEAFGKHDKDVIPLVNDLRRVHVRAELVAVTDSDEIVGHVMLSRSWLDARERLVEVLVLSPLSVSPAHQKRGIGTSLVSAAVDTASSLGVPALFLEGSPAYYSRRGFVPAASLGFIRPSARIPEPAFQVVQFSSREPWMLGAIIYCEPFWMHDCVGLRDPRLAEMERSGQ
ncbi:acyl-CoA N-acyltransferase [Thozetella sp. PMI_491]|nr:acyl-CoA N-acyltransferase [Thozetella sp. PMI_491]